jgi:predicted PurR-regulated permease PerM
MRMRADAISVAASQRDRRSATVALRWTVLLLSVGALCALGPLWAPLLLAAFSAIVAAPLHGRISKRVRGRKGAAAVITVGVVVLLLFPLATGALSVYSAALDLATQLRGSKGAADAWQRFLSENPNTSIGDARGLWDLARKHGISALTAAQSVFGAAATAAVGVFVFVYGFHTFLLDGRRAYAWALRHSPIPRTNLHRLGDAFIESARGLLIGVGLTALAQGIVATIGYIALGVPQALVLGLLTCAAALIPSVGTALIWAPVALGLFLSGRPQAGGILIAIGAFVSVVDNFIRPALSRFGKLSMSSFLVLVAMLGGIVFFGAFGLLLGPLFVRLAIEGWEILHDDGLDAAPHRSASPEQVDLTPELGVSQLPPESRAGH